MDKARMNRLPSKFLNFYDLGMKMYASKPNTAQLYFPKKAVTG